MSPAIDTDALNREADAAEAASRPVDVSRVHEEVVRARRAVAMPPSLRKHAQRRVRERWEQACARQQTLELENHDG